MPTTSDVLPRECCTTLWWSLVTRRTVEAADHRVHMIGYLAVTGLIAWVVYSKLGRAVLRTAGLNLNLAWAAALVVTSVVTLLI
jgi:hypothetical protein